MTATDQKPEVRPWNFPPAWYEERAAQLGGALIAYLSAGDHARLRQAFDRVEQALSTVGMSGDYLKAFKRAGEMQTGAAGAAANLIVTLRATAQTVQHVQPERKP